VTFLFDFYFLRKTAAINPLGVTNLRENAQEICAPAKKKHSAGFSRQSRGASQNAKVFALSLESFEN
jgi:hypothetical protein